MFTTPTDVRSSRPAIVVATLATLCVALLAVLPNVMASARPAPATDLTSQLKRSSYGLWSESTVPAVKSDNETSPVTLGLEFSSDTDGQLTGVQYYAAGANRAAARGWVWNASGNRVASVSFPESSSDGWKTAWLSSPAKIRAGEKYTVSYRAPNGRYAIEQNAFSGGDTLSSKNLTAHRGTYTYGWGEPTSTWRGSHYFVDVAFVPSSDSGEPAPTSTPTPTTAPTSTPTTTPTSTPTTSAPTTTPTTSAPTTTPTTSAPTSTPTTSAPTSTEFPNAANTGPTGTLASTSGNPRITTSGTVIENREHTGTLQVAASGVIIRNVHLVGNITVEPGASVTILDSLVDNGTNFNSGAISGAANITVRRTEVVGGGHSFSCKSNCDIQDSWFHGQANPPSSMDVHGDGILFNQANNMIVKHNTLACDMPADGGGACSAGLAMYGDWGPVQNVLVENNLFKSSPAGYCMYGGNVAGKPYGASNVDVINNQFEKGSSGKCSVYGPYSARATDSASSWTGNKYTDGTAVN